MIIDWLVYISSTNLLIVKLFDSLDYQNNVHIQQMILWRVKQPSCFTGYPK